MESRILLRTIASTFASVVVEMAPICTTPRILPRLASRNAPVASGGTMSKRRRLAMLRHLKSSEPSESLMMMSAPAASRAAAMFEPMNPAPPVITTMRLLRRPAERSSPPSCRSSDRPYVGAGDDGGRAVTSLERNQNDLAAIGSHEIGADNGRDRVVSALDKIVRLQQFDEP